MPNAQGDFIWYELLTPDAGAAADFYAGLLGWQVRDDPEYREITASEGMIGGMLQLTPDMTSDGARPAWVGYIAVDDVDATVSAVTAAGGRVLMPARDMAGIGRFAMVADPQGAPFYVMRPIPPANDPDATSHAFAAKRPMQGHCAWNELATSDPAAAWAFYTARFGWVKDGDMDMGPMGKYEFVRQADYMLGAIMPKLPQMPVSAWTYYFRVADIDAAVTYLRDKSATLLRGPDQIPGGDYSLVAMDPHGAAFGLVGPRR